MFTDNSGNDYLNMIRFEDWKKMRYAGMKMSFEEYCNYTDELIHNASKTNKKAD